MAFQVVFLGAAGLIAALVPLAFVALFRQKGYDREPDISPSQDPGGLGD